MCMSGSLTVRACEEVLSLCLFVSVCLSVCECGEDGA